MRRIVLFMAEVVMRVAVDGRSVFQDTAVRGIGKSLIGLYRALARFRSHWHFDFYFQDFNGLPNPFADLPNVTLRAVSGRGDRLDGWLNFWLPWSAWRSGATVLHCHNNTAPPVSVVPLVTTIHDLTPMSHPTGDPRVGKWVRNVRRAARTSRRVLVPSEATRRELGTQFGVPASKIDVVRWGPTVQITRAGAERMAAVRAKYGLSGEYLLHFGMTLPRKNTARVIEAWNGLPDPARNGSTLLLVGVESEAGVRRFLSHGSESVRVVGYVPDADVAPLLSAAMGLIYVPLAEGFGMPVLDAYACETPLIASNCSSIPEIAGSAALLVDPESIVALRGAMVQLLTDTAVKNRLQRQGRERLLHFNWDSCAGQVATVLERVARR